MIVDKINKQLNTLLNSVRNNFYYFLEIPIGTVAQAIQKGPDGQMIKKSIMLTPAQMVIIRENVLEVTNSSHN